MVSCTWTRRQRRRRRKGKREKWRNGEMENERKGERKEGRKEDSLTIQILATRGPVTGYIQITPCTQTSAWQKDSTSFQAPRIFFARDRRANHLHHLLSTSNRCSHETCFLFGVEHQNRHNKKGHRRHHQTKKDTEDDDKPSVTRGVARLNGPPSLPSPQPSTGPTRRDFCAHKRA